MSSFYVKVTNGNDFDLDDHFDGRRYEFPAGKTVSIPFDAACHIFGVEHPEQLKDKDKLLSYVCRRWGWNTKEFTATKEHIKRFDNIKIVLGAYKVMADDGSMEDEGLLPASRAITDAIMEDDKDHTVPPAEKSKRGQWFKKSPEAA